MNGARSLGRVLAGRIADLCRDSDFWEMVVVLLLWTVAVSFSAWMVKHGR